MGRFASLVDSIAKIEAFKKKVPYTLGSRPMILFSGTNYVT